MQENLVLLLSRKPPSHKNRDPTFAKFWLAVEPVHSAVEWKNEIGLPVPDAPTPTIDKKGIEPLFKRRI